MQFHEYEGGRKLVNSASSGQNGHHFADIFKHIFLYENIRISIQMSMKYDYE